MFSHSLSSLKSFVDKKFTIIITDQIPSTDIAYTCSMIGFQFGRVTPNMVGRDQNIPSESGSRVHRGITTQNLPVLNGLNYENMRAIREKLKGEENLFVTCLTDAVATCATYDEYVREVLKRPESSTNYWGIGIFGDKELVNQYTQGLKLYAKQPKTPNPKTATPRLVGSRADLPKVSFIFANDLTGGQLGNAGVVLGATLGKLYGDDIFGASTNEHAALSIGLPMVDLSILNGHPASNVTMRELREKLHSHTGSGLQVVDVTDATGKTRDYTDYLKLAENTKVLDTTYWGIGISGSKEEVAQYTQGLVPYITATEEKESEKALKNPVTVKAKQADGKSTFVGKSSVSSQLFTPAERPAVKATAVMDAELQALFNQAKRSAATPGKVTFTFTDLQLAKEFQRLLFEKDITDFFDKAKPRNIKEITDNNSNVAYELVFVKGEYNWLVNNDKAFDKLLAASQKLSEQVASAPRPSV